MSIRAVIVDDDSWAAQDLRDIIARHLIDQVDVVAMFSNPIEALEYLQHHPIQLVFLDVRMPGLSGFDLLNKLDSSQFEVIFCTAYDEYAIQAIRYSALDYLLKPINPEELAKAVVRFRERSEKNLTALKLQNLHENLNKKPDEDVSLVISSKQGEHRFVLSDIVRCEAQSNYTTIFLRNHKKYLASKTLSDIEEMLSPLHFIRVHKSHLVNLSHITTITASDELLMMDESRLPVSRRRLPEVRLRVRR
jgi:two-component system LytT family response regulator